MESTLNGKSVSKKAKTKQLNNNASSETLTPNDKELEKPVQIPNTPFALVQKQEGWVVVFGKWMISARYFETKEEGLKFMAAWPWDIILNIAGIIAEDFVKEGIKNVTIEQIAPNKFTI